MSDLHKEKVMAFCTHCGTKLEGEVNFCPVCGTRAGVPAVPPSAVVTEKAGNIRKCPACGAEVPAMSAKCTFCGHEFINVQIGSNVRAFFEKLDLLDDEIYHRDSRNQDKLSPASAAGALVGLHQLMSMARGLDSAVKRKINMIEAFPVSNSREDILEFMLMAVSRVNFSGVKMWGNLNWITELREQHRMNNAWKTKIKQTYTKAKIVFASDKDAMSQIEPLMAEFKLAEKKAFTKRAVIIGIVAALIIAVYGGLIWFAISQ
jgi:predicted RNA-binding Zn-ribbon protein involved in translation (DUF1610 family)